MIIKCELCGLCIYFEYGYVLQRQHRVCVTRCCVPTEFVSGLILMEWMHVHEIMQQLIACETNCCGSRYFTVYPFCENEIYSFPKCRPGFLFQEHEVSMLRHRNFSS
jgi:hypothetical protein